MIDPSSEEMSVLPLCNKRTESFVKRVVVMPHDKAFSPCSDEHTPVTTHVGKGDSRPVVAASWPDALHVQLIAFVPADELEQCKSVGSPDGLFRALRYRRCLSLSTKVHFYSVAKCKLVHKLSFPTEVGAKQLLSAWRAHGAAH